MDDRALLLPYQRRWIADRAAVAVMEKSRRVGISWAEAAQCVLTAGASRSAGGMSCYYISYNLDMTRQFVDDCAGWARALEIAASAVGEAILQDDGRDVKTYRIDFASGFEIQALVSSPRALRSKQGRVVLDEAAFVDDLDEVLRAAFAMMVWGGCVRVISTHNGVDNAFADLVADVKSGKKPYAHHKVTLDDALNQGLYRRICEQQGKAWSGNGQQAWRDDLLQQAGEAAAEEYFCIPRQGGMAYFPRSLVEACMSEDMPVLRLVLKDDFVFFKERRREKRIRSFFEDEVAPCLAAENFVYAGMDFGRSGDLSVLWLVEEQGDRLRTMAVLELRNCPFAQQQQLVQLVFAHLEHFGGAAFDARGNGQMLAELMAQEWPGYVQQVMISRGWYLETMPRLKSRLEDRELSVPKDNFLLDDFRCVGLKDGVPQVISRSGGVGQQRHGDSVVALALALYAQAEDGGGYQPYRYAAVSADNPWAEREVDEWTS